MNDEASKSQSSFSSLPSVELTFPTLFLSLPSVKNPFARRGRRVYGYGKPQVRHGESVSPRRPDEEGARHFTMARKNAAPLARRRVD